MWLLSLQTTMSSEFPNFRSEIIIFRKILLSHNTCTPFCVTKIKKITVPISKYWSDAPEKEVPNIIVYSIYLIMAFKHRKMEENNVELTDDIEELHI